MDQAQRRFLWTQQAVGVVLNALISALFVWLVFGGAERIGLWGARGLAADLVPTTFMITLMMTFALSRITRMAVASGKLPPLAGPSRFPRHLLARAPLLALGATILLVPATVAVLTTVWTRDWSYGEVLWFKIAYGIALGLIATPVIVGAAMRDGPAPVRT